MSLLFTTTGVEIDEELLNRCLVLTVNESREGQKADREHPETSREGSPQGGPGEHDPDTVFSQ